MFYGIAINLIRGIAGGMGAIINLALRQRNGDPIHDRAGSTIITRS